MKISTVRHGLSEANKECVIDEDPKNNTLLAPKGIIQAAQAGELLKNERPDIIYVSEFGRTQQTAMIINHYLGIPVVVDARINEMITGKNWQHFKVYRELNQLDPHHGKFPGGESFTERKKRIFSFLYEISQKEHQHIVIVSHANPITIIHGFLEGNEEPEIQRKRIENAQVDHYNLG